MYIKYTEQEKQYLERTIKTTYIIDLSEVFSVMIDKKIAMEENKKEGVVISRTGTEQGVIHLYKTNKTFQVLYFDSHRNTEEFADAIEKYIGKNKGDTLISLNIEYYKAPAKDLLAECNLQKKSEQIKQRVEDLK